MAANPIVFKITNAGKRAALSDSIETTSFSIDLVHVAIGTGRYNKTGNETALKAETGRMPIVSGDVEASSNTLRFTSSMSASTITPVYEMGLITSEGVLFAIASSSSQPFFTVHPDITFVGAFGLSLRDVSEGSVTVTTDPNGALSITIMEQHLASPNPHPQYAYGTLVQELANIVELLKGDLMATQFELLSQRLTVIESQILDILATTIETYKVGDVFTTTIELTATEVATRHGYGTWVRYAEGRTLVGFSTKAGDPADYKTMGGEFGANTHTLTLAESPSHKHSQNAIFNKFAANYSDYVDSDATENTSEAWGDGATQSANEMVARMPAAKWLEATEKSAGSDLPHNNIQPSKVTARWLRTA